MRTPTQLTDTLGKMQTYLETPVGHDPQELIDRTELLTILIAKSGQCLAEAKYIQDQIINEGLMKAINIELDKKLTPSLITKFVSSNAKDINYLVTWADRVNAAATHQLDGIRSIISYKKAEMNL